MAEQKVKVKKIKKIKVKGVLLLIFIVSVIIVGIYAILNLPIKQIYITGTTNISDNEIILDCGLKDYPPIYKVKINKMKETLLSNPLIKNVKIKRNIFGKLTIDIEEDKVLFLNRSNNSLVIAPNKEIPNNNKYTKLPILINIVPDDIYEQLITGLYKIDYDIVMSISEIEYSPSVNADGEIIDNTRFYLRMNDGNAVIMNIVNIKRLNDYNDIFASIGDEKGTIYLDSIYEESTYFKSFELEKQEQLEKEEANKENDKKED